MPSLSARPESQISVGRYTPSARVTPSSDSTGSVPWMTNRPPSARTAAAGATTSSLRACWSCSRAARSARDALRACSVTVSLIGTRSFLLLEICSFLVVRGKSGDPKAFVRGFRMPSSAAGRWVAEETAVVAAAAVSGCLCPTGSCGPPAHLDHHTRRHGDHGFLELLADRGDVLVGEPDVGAVAPVGDQACLRPALEPVLGDAQLSGGLVIGPVTHCGPTHSASVDTPNWRATLRANLNDGERRPSYISLQ